MVSMSHSASRNSSPQSESLDSSQAIDDFIAELLLDPNREPVASELGVLQSIYGDDAIRPWHPSHDRDDVDRSVDGRSSDKIRYEVNLRLPSPHEDVPLRILVSLPLSYPATSPPQLQLLSRYIGAFGVNSELFGSILKTFISMNGVEWAPDNVCVFDGLESVVERVAKWYEDHLSTQIAGELLRADAKECQAERRERIDSTIISEPTGIGAESSVVAEAELPKNIEIVEAEAIIDRKSVFVGRACRISDPSQGARAAHPVINAWRCQVGTVLHQDNDDDGESAAGGRLAHLLQILDVNNVLVIVTRYYGGIHLGPDRFKHINQAARDALELGGFLDIPDAKRHDGRGKGTKRSTLVLKPTVAFFRMASTSSFGLKDSSLIKTQGFVNGQWIDAKSGGKIMVTNPATEEELGTIPEMGVEETKEAINAAAEAFKTWSKTTAKHRHDILIKYFQLMQEHAEDLARIITLENGKTFAEAKGENAYSASFLEWFAEEAVRTYGEHIPSAFPGVRNIVIKQPIGVVSILTPWNFPSAMITRKLGAALAAGCTAVIKPPPETPFSALALTELAKRAGVPDGVINVVTTQKNVSEVAKELCENKIVKKVSFTGSTPVAKLLYGMASSTLKKVSLEAGGNAPFIVFDDADIDQAVEGAIICKFRGSGQTCVCANRIYVQSSVYAEFASRLADRVATFKVGNGLDEKTTHGPLIHDRAVEKVKGHVNDAVSKGAQILIGGDRPEGAGSFFAPTILSEVPSHAIINHEETFGPVAALTKFETEEEVIKLANNTDVGLAGYFFSRDVGRVWRVAEALEVGMVGTNTGAISQAVIPFGGVKESGLGREGSHGIKEYMNTKFIAFGGL
ncbi:hypothetical protein EW146_g3794 [Bondarzewia mesenterica]|uniref:succinate-semialdehyde dehydrogenase [NAD(P)(+)] n=1 Tax=Bondarzewia mesenterica TaxID=1095465 RepID=A0A4S4LYN3_9AGAM|nr:hypothetical protein EW146_g3794 [Bondarzewia mesenterica]